MTEREYLTTAEVAALLRISASTVKRLAKAGKLPGAVQLDVQWRFRRDEVLKLGRADLQAPGALKEPGG